MKIKKIIEKVIYWGFVLFVGYLIYEIIKKIFGGSMGYEQVMVALLVTNITFSFYLARSLSKTEARLVARINEVENKLSKRINEVENKLSERISGVESKLSGQINKLNTRFSEHLGWHKGKLPH